MHPELLQIGPFVLKSYGLMLAIAFRAGIFVALKRASKFGVKPQEIMDTALVIIISAIIGSRFFYVIFHLQEFEGRWLDIINPLQSSGACGIAGFSMMGGVALALIAAPIYAKIRKLNFLQLADTIAPSFLLGAGITRIGCFLNGCCFGKPTTSPLGLQFPPDSPAGFICPYTRIHPTQLYASALGLILFAILLLLEKKMRKGPGFTLGGMMVLYSLDRFVVDIFRYYEKSMVLMKIGTLRITNNEAILFFMIIVGAFLIIRSRGRK